MLITYVIYCIALHFNPILEKWAHTLPVPFKQTAPTEESGLVSYKTLEEDGKHQTYGIQSPDPLQDAWDNPDQGEFIKNINDYFKFYRRIHQIFNLLKIV